VGNSAERLLIVPGDLAERDAVSSDAGTLAASAVPEGGLLTGGLLEPRHPAVGVVGELGRTGFCRPDLLDESGFTQPKAIEREAQLWL